MLFFTCCALSACGSGWAKGESGTAMTGSAASDDVGIGRIGDQPVNALGSLGYRSIEPDPLSR